MARLLKVLGIAGDRHDGLPVQRQRARRHVSAVVPDLLGEPSRAGLWFYRHARRIRLHQPAARAVYWTKVSARAHRAGRTGTVNTIVQWIHLRSCGVMSIQLPSAVHAMMTVN